MIPSIIGLLVIGVGVGLVYVGVHGAPWLNVYPKPTLADTTSSAGGVGSERNQAA